MMYQVLQAITPVVLTYDEESNIGKILDSLGWAKKVIVLDSGSTDQTQKIAASYPNVEWHTRAFDSFLGQWDYAIQETLITTEYILGLDADMEVSSALIEEISNRFLLHQFEGGLIPFEYRYYGHRLANSLCPPQLRLFRRNSVEVMQLNHGHKFIVKGKVYRFANRLIHDDRKPLERWVNSQLRYQLENELELSNGGRGRPRDFLRKLGLMPPLMGLLAYLRAGGPFKGAAAARYAYERTVAEGLLAIRLMDARIEKPLDARIKKPSDNAKRS